MEFLKMVWNWVCRTASARSVKPCIAQKRENSQNQRKAKPVDMLTALTDYLLTRYDFRYNLLTEETEFRRRNVQDSFFIPIGARELNSFCMDARQEGINCWDRDISRYINSDKISVYHPFRFYMEELPEWDGKDRVTELAERVSGNTIWKNGFHRWMLGLTAQWLGMTDVHANGIAPLLVSLGQGKLKSTFCRILMPSALLRYYTDSFDLSSPTQAERKLAAFGLINLDEFDKFPPSKTALLKNLMQMSGMNLRKAYKKNYSSLPRIASFIGTSNRKDLLTDPRGSRRFLCVEIDRKIDCTDIDHAQIYAQLKAELQNGERYWFSSEEETEIMQHNTAFYWQSPEEEVFHSCFRPAGKGEACSMISGADIFKRLKKFNSAAMREAAPSKFVQVLVKNRVERVHTKYGNLYRVVEIER